MSQMPNKAPGPTPTSVHIERHFDVLPGKVWRGWTDPEVVRQWFGSDPAGKVLAVQLDVRPGGSFEVSFMDSDGTEHTCSGVYADVQPETKLSFSWRWKSEPGVETFVSVLLERRGTGTQMYFEHAQVGSASLHDHATGWRLENRETIRHAALMIIGQMAINLAHQNSAVRMPEPVGNRHEVQPPMTAREAKKCLRSWNPAQDNPAAWRTSRKDSRRLLA